MLEASGSQITVTISASFSAKLQTNHVVKGGNICELSVKLYNVFDMKRSTIEVILRRLDSLAGCELIHDNMMPEAEVIHLDRRVQGSSEEEEEGDSDEGAFLMGLYVLLVLISRLPWLVGYRLWDHVIRNRLGMTGFERLGGCFWVVVLRYRCKLFGFPSGFQIRGPERGQHLEIDSGESTCSR